MKTRFCQKTLVKVKKGQFKVIGRIQLYKPIVKKIAFTENKNKIEVSP